MAPPSPPEAPPELIPPNPDVKPDRPTSLKRRIASAIPPAAQGPGAARQTAVRTWFDDIAETTTPRTDGTLISARDAATAYARLAKAENTRRAYRAAVRAWCDWCDQHGLSPLPARGADVAAFLADERGRDLSPETLKLRRAAIRYLHRAAGHPVPTDDVCVSETMAGIQRDAARQGQTKRKKLAATAPIIRRLIAPIPEDLRGLRDIALILVGFAGALRRAELAAIQIEHLEATARGIRLTLPQTKGDQTQAVTGVTP